MAMKKSSSGATTLSPHSYNDFGPGTADEAQWPVGEAYADYEQCMRAQNSQDNTSMVGTPNSSSGSGIMGGVAPGEPDPVGYVGHARGMGSKER